MKKILLLVFVLSICTFSFAQHAQFGIKGGLNAARLKVDNVNENDIQSRINFHLGGLAHIHLNRNWAIQPEIVYSGQGMTQELGNTEYDWKLNYINVPVLLQYMFDGGFRLQAGPQIGILTNAEIENKETGATSSLDDDLNQIDFSIPVGLAYLSPSGLGIDARYNIGLNNINKNGVNDIKNRVLQVGVFYQFRK